MGYRHWGFLPMLGLIGACTVGPDYVRPPAPMSAAYKEAAREEGWRPAAPADASDRGAWWTIYRDPDLDELASQVAVSNQNLKAAEAAYRRARAIVEEANAAFYPTLAANGSGQRSGLADRLQGGGGGRGGSTMAANLFSLGVNAGWSLDVWGRIRRTVEADTAGAQASAADVASARLSAEAQLASAYFQLRSADELKRLLEVSVTAYTRSLDIVSNRHQAGTATLADVLTAQTQLKATEAQLIGVGVQRAQFEHAIAVLIGKPPAELSIPAKPSRVPYHGQVPAIPVGVPSALLERRPDIASAERQMAANNAAIGVAEAAFYPDLTLSASLLSSGAAFSNLFDASASLWSFGAKVAGTLFDAGARSARVAEAQALYEQTLAHYRQTVLTAFQQVEDQLAAQRILTDQAAAQAETVRLAREAERLTLDQYRAGTVAYTAVLTAQTTALVDDQNALAIQQNRLLASVGLIQALGGGWDAAELKAAGK